eukprot:GEMP01058516.1.p1 GENE.GEMP01058516.1~~GEMP01058516.1.p1  ORF type:complete len:147 (+),score=39.29 GEMP01058516.1:41-481(+)
MVNCSSSDGFSSSDDTDARQNTQPLAKARTCSGRFIDVFAPGDLSGKVTMQTQTIMCQSDIEELEHDMVEFEKMNGELEEKVSMLESSEESKVMEFLWSQLESLPMLHLGQAKDREPLEMAKAILQKVELLDRLSTSQEGMLKSRK